jgi:hypothetical protein
MFDLAIKALSKLPVLKKERNPNVAGAIGFLLGGVGLGIYFRSFIDFLVPLGIVVALVAMSSSIAAGLASLGWLGGAVIAGLYGYYRARQSNERRSPDSATTPALIPH